MNAPGEREILAQLATIGYEFESLADLRTSGLRYRDAVPILIEALSSGIDRRGKEEVVRALSVPWAKPAAVGPLIEQFREVEDASGLGLRWSIGNALSVTWHDSYFDELVELARDTRFGRAREMLVLGLGKSKNAQAGEVLIDLLDDPDVGGHAVKAIRKMKLPAARERLQEKLADRRAWVRKEAERALFALDSDEGRGY